jgi:aminopeptidase-like protein
VGKRRFRVTLPERATMMEMIHGLWTLPRDIVSDGYDAALRALAGQLPMEIHDFPSGTECWSWIVPERWSCREAYLETLDGRRLFAYSDHPLHVVSYSLPFNGVVTRAELLAHLHVHPLLDDAIPFIFKYYERDWGLCCTREQRDALTDDSYRVVIRSEFSYGALRVGEVVVPGRSYESVVLCAHLCHPHMVNDDLSGVVVGMDVMRELIRRPPGRFTYRFLIVPETIGSLAWLSRHEALLPRLRGGLFLEMLGLDQPLALQHSFAGDSAVDRCFAMALAAADPDGWTGEFRTIIGNDERQFNAPGVRVPMLSLSRVRRPGDPAWPYPEYHSSRDTPALASDARLTGARDAVLRMLDTLEADVTPVNRFRGELFCSRYGIHVDAYANPEGHRALFDIMYLVDGTRSVSAIASELGIPFEAVSQTIAELRRHGVVTT